MAFMSLRVVIGVLLAPFLLQPPGASAVRGVLSGASKRTVSTADTRNQLQWKTCNMFNVFRGLKQYRFEFMVNQGDHMALQLVRLPYERPQLFAHPNMTWKARLSTHGLEWSLAPAGSRNPPSSKGDDLLEELRFIRHYTQLNGEGEELQFLEITHLDNSTQTLVEGLYFPEDLMRKALTYAHDHQEELGELENASAHFLRQSNTSMDLLGDYNSGVGSAAGMGAGVGMVGGGSALAASLVYAFGPFASASWLAITGGALGGMALGSGVGALALTVSAALVAGPIFLHTYIKRSHEHGLTATQKIFEKLRCHPEYLQCSGDVLIPVAKSAAAECP